MSDIDKYCCFTCPQEDHSEKPLSSTCPICGKKYSFMLDFPPDNIREYKIIKPLGRGFYGATYVAEVGDLIKIQCVVKITPVEFYAFFNKPSFMDEVTLHRKLTENQSAFVVGINNAFEEDVTFSDPDGTALRCYVTVLEYIKGHNLKDYFEGIVPVSSSTICQIAIDLLLIRSELESSELNHNDLHAKNVIVEELGQEYLRKDAIQKDIRLKAIDLGSVAGGSKSGGSREGDLLSIAGHIDSLLKALLDDPERLEDKDYRSALALQGLIQGLISQVQNARLPNYSDLIEDLQNIFWDAQQPWRPWEKRLTLKSFGDHYNAQTLASWHVPALLVDPDNRWLRELSISGPQIITGMRGCGKTMLLRALDLHARLASKPKEQSVAIKTLIKEDGFVGLLVRAQRLLELREPSLSKTTEYHLSKLFVCYSLEAVRCLMHLSAIDNSDVTPLAYKKLAQVVNDCISDATELISVNSLDQLESKLERMLVLITKEQHQRSYVIKHSPDAIFNRLAEEFKKCSPLFADSYVLFLLDDVSTRYLSLDQIALLVSSLLFQSTICAFKFTSEWQTFELGLNSPGGNHPIRVDRDVSTFDLGADVYKTIKKRGSSFVADILRQRALLYPQHLKRYLPAELLGDISLEEVAKEIASSSDTSATRKNAYRGLTCLTRVCVGDIGDIIKLYEEMLNRVKSNVSAPIPQHIQAECFQALSSRRLYDLNRRGGLFRDHAYQFAQAAHTLLVKSHEDLSKTSSTRNRLRQYSSIYVRITAAKEDGADAQINALRELIDAGVFVYTGGSPRTKTRDSDPTHQFKLTYRKIYGLASFIGLADSDRFELSGPKLQSWLENPTQAKEILLTSKIETDETEEDDTPSSENISERVIEVPVNDGANTRTQQNTSVQLNLFDVVTDDLATQIQPTPRSYAAPIDVDIQRLDCQCLNTLSIDSVFAGLGFEERTLKASEYLSTVLSPCVVNAIQYSSAGKADQILINWESKKFDVHKIPYDPANFKCPPLPGNTLVDITGLAKPLIFAVIRNELLEKKTVYISYASALRHYPLQEDINDILSAKESSSVTEYLDKLSGILMGEKGPYKRIPLIEDNSDPSRDRTLLAFASAKHERLFSLLERRDYDNIEIIASNLPEPRSKIATIAAQFLCESYSNAKISYFDTNDLTGLLSHLDSQYLLNYGVARNNLEIGLTGSKLQAVAAAVLSARRKISQAWYISPKAFDEKRFTEGFGELYLYKVSRSTT